MKVPATASFFSAARERWDTIRVLLNDKPTGMTEKAYWDTEIRVLRARHDELRDASAFVIVHADEKGWW